MNSIEQLMEDEHVRCTGCAACQNICARDAIEMKADVIDGYKPFVLKNKCVNCGRCVDVCPAITEDKNLNFPTEGYAAIAKDNIRKKSSSGGFFTVVAEKILKFGDGVVYGVSWDEKLKAVHMREVCIEGLEKLRYSKYVQSDTSNIFRAVKKDLKDGKKVLFSGTPCQIAGLKRYIETENIESKELYLLDLICESAPSPILWEMYLNERYNDSNLPSDYRFRDKIHGWRTISNCLVGSIGSSVNTVEDYYVNFR